ncbi:hypothetical protein DM813_27140 [Pseudomonas alkylphenolica]|uniref:Uncharacterized protein n=1 Tax=Pseudomonas alkylphenolica TaxID=237609 RepID=A0A443ZEI3_9PSED|nr:hypothetical protein [Pseudomonas alkylphenolica]RWU17041.1 hypothetical protein DM813_27140 [Pseudomonas alkylphenolica]
MLTALPSAGTLTAGAPVQILGICTNSEVLLAALRKPGACAPQICTVVNHLLEKVVWPVDCRFIDASVPDAGELIPRYDGERSILWTGESYIISKDGTHQEFDHPCKAIAELLSSDALEAWLGTPLNLSNLSCQIAERLSRLAQNEEGDDLEELSLKGSQRAGSMPNLVGIPLMPGIHHRKDTLIHPFLEKAENAPGALSTATSSSAAWQTYQCHPISLVETVEVHAGRGLVNLIGNGGFASGELSQSTKRDVERAVTAVIAAYNGLQDSHGLPLLTIHENHLVGDGNVHEDFHLPRQANPKDYDYYHTLGVKFGANGKMHPHYHLEFHAPLTQEMLGSVLEALSRVSTASSVMSGSDVDGVLALYSHLPGNREKVFTDQLLAGLQRLPSEINDARERTKVRDELKGEFIALSSANTEIRTDTPVRNMHMNAFRPPEPLLECFYGGNTNVEDYLRRIEEGLLFNAPVAQLLGIYQELRHAASNLSGIPVDGNDEQLTEANQRLSSAMGKLQHWLAA